MVNPIDPSVNGAVTPASTFAAAEKVREAARVNEESILKKIRRWCEPTSLNSTLTGVGDDAAVLATSGRPIVFASDFSIENAHFDFKFSSAEDVGHKSLARVLSDVAAMGASPLAVTISIAVPKSYAESQVEEFLEGYFKGAVAIAMQTKCTVAGGDLTRIEGPLVIDVAAVGELRPHAKAWLRSGAAADDEFFISGDLGGAAFALEQLKLSRRDKLSPAQLAKHLRPNPRFDIGAQLAPNQSSNITAAMDISDGLIQDAYRLCQASNVSLILEEAALQLSPGATIKHALTGGDDYELMLAVRRNAPKIAGASQLGAFVANARPDSPEVFLQHENGTRTLLASLTRSPGGYDPFRDV